MEDTIRRSLEGQFPQVTPDNFHSRQYIYLFASIKAVRTRELTGLAGSGSTRRKASC